MGRAAHEHIVREFFREYQRQFALGLQDPAALDVKAVRRAFADYFVGASPAGVMGGRNGLMFRFLIPRGFAYYRKVGTERMEITGLEVTSLDDLHVTAEVHWRADCRRKDGTEVSIPFTNFYFLQVRDGEARIFAYATGDEQGAMRAAGLTD